MLKKIVYLSLLLTGCSEHIPTITKEPIQDLATIPQTMEAYTEFMKLARPISPSVYQESKKAFFGPWLSNEFIYPKNVIIEYNDSFKIGWGENLMPHDPSWFEEHTYNANYDAYASAKIPAIIVQNTSLRALPTSSPHFHHPEKAGEGYPFDNLSAMSLYCGNPILISHYSRDKAWALVQTNSKTFGWVDARHLATLTQKQQKELMNMNWGALLKENEPIYEGSRFYDQTKLGMLLPVKGNGEIMVPKKTSKGNLEFFTTRNLTISLKLLEFNVKNISKISNQLLGKTYGWGDYLFNRDCSTTTKDFFAPFGIWLPKNSKAQIQASGKIYAFDNMQESEKLELIKTHAIPFQTLIYAPGHIGLYVGQNEKGPLMLHNRWGNNTKNGHITGRNVIGKTIISTLEFGKELHHFDQGIGTFLQTITAMNVLGATSYNEE